MRERTAGFLKAMVLFLLILFVPTLRTCAGVAYGFPTVAVEASDPFTIAAFRPIALALNTVVLAAVFAALYFLVFRRFRTDRKLRVGLKSLYLYNGLTYAGFWLVYWLLASESEAVGTLVMGYSFLLYGPLFLLNDIEILSDLSRESPFFGDPGDIKVRLVYATMSLIWFAVGFLAELIAERVRARGDRIAKRHSNLYWRK